MFRGELPFAAFTGVSEQGLRHQPTATPCLAGLSARPALGTLVEQNKVSVVIVTYDNAHEIGPCLAAVLEQDGGPPDVVVVDNGSKDGTPDIVRGFPVQLIEQPNLGFGAGNNRGVAETSGDILVFLNPDTVVEPGFLRHLTEAVGPSRSATAQIILRQDPGRINTAGHRLHYTGFGFLVDYNAPRKPPGQPYEVQGVSGAAFAMRRQDFLRLGGFDPDFFLYMEDTELSWRMQRVGFQILMVPSAVTTHDYAAGFPSQKIEYLETGRLLLLRKHLAWWLWLAYLPALALAEILAWGRACWMGWPGLAAKAKGTRSGWRRGIRRYDDLPRARPHLFASQTIPFTMLSRRWIVKWGGALFNAAFRLNTLAWRFRKDRTARRP